MLKLLIFVVGLGAGTAGSVSWLLSEPSDATAPTVPTTSDGWRARLDDLRIRFDAALTEGKRAGAETERRLHAELDAYRKGSA